MAVHEVDVDQVEGHVEAPERPVELVDQVCQGQVALPQVLGQQFNLVICKCR